MSWKNERERHVLASKGVKTKKNKHKHIANNIDCPKCHKDNCFVNTEGKTVFVHCHNCGYKDSQQLEDDVFTCHSQQTYEFNELSSEAAKKAAEFDYPIGTRFYKDGTAVY